MFSLFFCLLNLGLFALNLEIGVVSCILVRQRLKPKVIPFNSQFETLKFKVSVYDLHSAKVQDLENLRMMRERISHFVIG